MSANRHLKISLSLILALAALLLPLLSIAGAAGITADETPLNPNGLAYELNIDSPGTLWVSDLGAGEIWSFDTTGVARTAYRVGGRPSDARGDGAGSAWWSDFFSNRLGRLSISTNQATIWEIPGSTGLSNTAIDSSGRVWVSDSDAPLIYRLNPNADPNQLCTYALPDLGFTKYMVPDGEALWFGDFVNARIVRLQGDSFDWWNLPAGSYPRDLDMDADGGLWWTDRDKGYVGRLDSGAATITTFTPPVSGKPVMLALSGGKIWYSLQLPTRVVELDPAVAASQSMPVTTGSQEAAPDCDELPPLAPTAITATPAQTSWTGQTYPIAVNAPGWRIYDMPAGSTLWGIAATQDKIWLVDQGRRVLARFAPPVPTSNVYLPLLQRQ
jgi:streptogramin lyase